VSLQLLGQKRLSEVYVLNDILHSLCRLGHVTLFEIRMHMAQRKKKFIFLKVKLDRLCGLVVRVLGYRSGGPGSIPGTTRKKKCSGSETWSTQPREYKLRSYLIKK
jgi:hypothetical protein